MSGQPTLQVAPPNKKTSILVGEARVLKLYVLFHYRVVI